MERSEQIRACLRDKGWDTHLRGGGLSFLAQGEYNENWLVETSDGKRVLRINHGSQLGIERQMEYEFTVLGLLAASGVTPRPIALSPDSCGLGRGAMLMEYLPGTPFDYVRDWPKAACVFARVHATPLPENHDLVVQRHPLRDIAAESLGLLRRYHEQHSLRPVGERLLRYHDEVTQLHERTRDEFAEEPLVLVNSEVNSGNFIVRDGKAWLVDWEKAVLSCRHQDLGHFLTPTTTLWKSDFRFDAAGRIAFLSAYAEAWREQTGGSLDLEQLDRRTVLLERAVLLRGLSWCYMAFHEYGQDKRALHNPDTMLKIRHYLDNVSCFLG
ncbi:MAG: aminoglycoside phosphotransferase family protein [Desulfovibrionaceae bacterium]